MLTDKCEAVTALTKKPILGFEISIIFNYRKNKI
jgi:hypothetical protein